MQVDPAVIAARHAVADVRRRMAEALESGAPAGVVCLQASDAFERIVVDAWEATLAGLRGVDPGPIRASVALLAVGGFGRRQMAPWSDIDVSLVHAPGVAEIVPAVARPFLQSLFDAGLDVGQSVRTVDEACELARQDASVLTALLDARRIAGNGAIAADLAHRVLAEARADAPATAARFLAARRQEVRRYGGKPALLEPNVKRSAGCLRDVQLVRWLSTVLHGATVPESLVDRGILTADDAATLHAAEEHLLHVRVALHLAEGRPADELTRPRQARLAESWRVRAGEGLLPVERFMRDFLGHTRGVVRVLDGLLPDPPGERVAGIGPDRVARIAARTEGTGASAPGRPTDDGPVEDATVVRLVGLAARHGLPIDREAWRRIRAAPRPDPPSPDSTAAFLALFDAPEGLGGACRRLHEIGLLEKFVPPFAHARNLLQFNDYHKYTVDEHCILAVERAVEIGAGDDWLGEAWSRLTRRRPLLLALLLHDLGKGFPEDHSVLGARMAREICPRLGLPTDEADFVEFLVLEHLTMAQLAFRRDAGDDSLVLPFARRTGSPEVLRMLAILTAADVAAVGPDTWTRWKADLLGDVFFRTLACLDGESGTGSAGRREAIRSILSGLPSDDPVHALAERLPDSALGAAGAERIVADLSRLARLPPGGVLATAEWQPDTATVAVTAATRTEGPVAFHRITGALTANRLAILAADVSPLGEGTLARFTVADGDFDGAPPPSRLAEIGAAIRGALGGGAAPTFSRRWNPFAPRVTASPPRVVVDNESSARTTIVEVFAADAAGLLYGVARTLSDAGLVVRSARIATRLDQVVDAFHVTDSDGAKLVDPDRIADLRRALERVASPLERPS